MRNQIILEGYLKIKDSLNQGYLSRRKYIIGILTVK